MREVFCMEYIPRAWDSRSLQSMLDIVPCIPRPNGLTAEVLLSIYSWIYHEKSRCFKWNWVFASVSTLKPRNLMNKDNRRYLDTAFSGSVCVVKWKDNKVVSVGSIKPWAEPIQSAQRWNRIEKKNISKKMSQIPHLSIITYKGQRSVWSTGISVPHSNRVKKVVVVTLCIELNAKIVNAWFQYRKNSCN